MNRLQRLAVSPAFAYAAVAAVQLKVMWGIWNVRDLSGGDSPHYWEYASIWAWDGRLDPLFGPAYTFVMGSLQWLVNDTYALMISHRLVIALAASLLVLAVMRSMLSATVALAIALWWAVLPVNYDTLTELHLFSLLPLLAAVLVAARWRSSWMPGTVFGILVATALLLRNELVVAALLWLAVCVGYWVRRHRGRAVPEPVASAGIRALAVPFAVVALAAMFLWGMVVLTSPTDRDLGQLVERVREKQDFALCQHYAVGYQQRHGGDQQLGWTDCDTFMQRDFGEPSPSFAAAFGANASAMGGHLRWNAELAPYGAQRALFDRTSGSPERNPDYVPTTTGSSLATVLSVLLLTVLALGALALRRSWDVWAREWISGRVWAWWLLTALAAMGVWVAITTHPRPSYFFPATVAVLAFTGLSLMAIGRRQPRLTAAGAAVPVAALLVVLLAPSHYDDEYLSPQLGPGRSLAEMVSRLEPYREEIARSETVLAARLAELGCLYLSQEEACVPAPDPLTAMPRGPQAIVWLDARDIDYIYAESSAIDRLARLGQLKELTGVGWIRLDGDGPPDGEWLLLARRAAE